MPLNPVARVEGSTRAVLDPEALRNPTLLVAQGDLGIVEHIFDVARHKAEGMGLRPML